MIKKLYFCDYCGKRIPKKKEIKEITTAWFWDIRCYSSIKLGGHGCKECFKSYRDWAISRKRE